MKKLLFFAGIAIMIAICTDNRIKVETDQVPSYVGSKFISYDFENISNVIIEKDSIVFYQQNEKVFLIENFDYYTIKNKIQGSYHIRVYGKKEVYDLYVN
ncbi:MAG: hypothetical protein IKL33_02090 [Alphaproteobacteria bacterium]|nr:hypothetical protein [Alphaproteobacteria bacterium]